jgi:hypothetical protein
VPALSGIEFHQRPVRRLVYRIDRQDAKRPAYRGLAPGSGGALHQAQEKLHGVLAQPLALAGQPLVKVAVA